MIELQTAQQTRAAYQGWQKTTPSRMGKDSVVENRLTRERFYYSHEELHQAFDAADVQDLITGEHPEFRMRTL